MMLGDEGVKAIEWRDDSLLLLDQRLLPAEEVYLRCTSLDSVIDAIAVMAVRGAPAIGIAAAYGAWFAVCEDYVEGTAIELNALIKSLDRLQAARPTAVNLAWAVSQVKALVTSQHGLKAPAAIAQEVLALASEIHAADLRDNHKMAELAYELMSKDVKQPFSVITHCNTGSLATAGYGTALGVIRKGWERSLIEHVYADETRPWLQGARLTAWELERDGIPVSLNVDGAAAWLMSKKGIKWAIVGADRIAANGDVANKIGTYALAIQARYHNVRFMVVAPSSSVDLSIKTGDDIEIEMRCESELKQTSGQWIAPQSVSAINPVFDVTPASLIDAIVTEKGVITAPDENKLAALLS